MLEEGMFSKALDILDKFEWMFRGGMKKLKDTFYPKEKLTYEEAAKKFLEKMNDISDSDSDATVVMRETLQRNSLDSLVDSLNNNMKVFKKHFEIEDDTVVEHVKPNDASKKKIISSIVLSPKTTVADKIALLWILLSGKPLVFN